MPNSSRNARQEFEERRIPGASFLDIDEVRDHASSLPHMLPTFQEFTLWCSKNGINRSTPVVIYDTQGLFSAARVWFMFYVYGARELAVLNGGLPMWEHLLYPIETDTPKKYPTKSPTKQSWLDQRLEYVTTYDDMLANAIKQEDYFTVLDARSYGRYTGELPEPRPNLPRFKSYLITLHPYCVCFLSYTRVFYFCVCLLFLPFY
jgi:thiosulfate/3-mercaptopyruvate sulfurtransferase